MSGSALWKDENVGLGLLHKGLPCVSIFSRVREHDEVKNPIEYF